MNRELGTYAQMIHVFRHVRKLSCICRVKHNTVLNSNVFIGMVIGGLVINTQFSYQ